MEHIIKNLIHNLGEDTEREGLLKTPQRAAKSWKFLTSGYKDSATDIVGDAIFTVENSSMVIIKDIEYYSLCEHHLLPFFGKASVGYIPNKKVIGLSKIPRIINMFARRLQIQEALTQQIAAAISAVTGAQGVGVVMKGKHMCMMMRGVEKQQSDMLTSSMLGCFLENEKTRHEFLSLIK
jgi:GTP cyclohydrolase IA